MNYINDDYSLTYNFNDPYPVWVLDNFLTDTLVQKIIDNWDCDYESDDWVSVRKTVNGMPNTLESGLYALNDKDKMPKIISECMDYFHGSVFLEFVKSLTGILDLQSDKTARWSGLRAMVPGAKQLIHSDARVHPENGLKKELTCLLYLNENYSKETDEGCLEIWDDGMHNLCHSIEPINNRMVIFKNSEKSYHGVPIVKKERRMITFSIMSDDYSTDRRQYAKFVPRPTDDESVLIIGHKRGYL
tara:strand:+ start:32 stop:766 length:735 start_codon:yes stop_codon:yes gene_type:complete